MTRTKATYRRIELCECGEPATMRVTITNLDGTLLDTEFVCADCLPEGYQIGKAKEG